MTEPPTDPQAAARAQKLRRQAEHRVIMQATMQANRAGRLPPREPARPLASALTAIGVVVVVLGMLVMVMRSGT